MKTRLIQWLNSCRYNSHFLRLLVGAYVAYLGGKLFYDQYLDGVFSPVFSFFGAVLLLSGILIAVISAYAVWNGYSQEYKGDTTLMRRGKQPEDVSGAENEEESQQ